MPFHLFRRKSRPPTLGSGGRLAAKGAGSNLKLSRVKGTKNDPDTQNAKINAGNGRLFDTMIHKNAVPNRGIRKRSESQRFDDIRTARRKIAAGHAIYQDIIHNNSPEPTRENISNLIWFLQDRAQYKVRRTFMKGAFTIPDKDKLVRKFLDSCAEKYLRDSSHLREMQSQFGGQARGIDFYGGKKDDDLLLPYGLNTLLYQQVNTGATNRLYIKLEDEGARYSPALSERDEDDVGPSRAKKKVDYWHSAVHGWNFIKATKLGITDDGGLSTFREQTPEKAVKAYDELKKAAIEERPEDAAVLNNGYDESKAIGERIRLHQLIKNVESWASPSEHVTAKLEQLWRAIDESILVGDNPNGPKSSTDHKQTFGGEIVLDDEDVDPFSQDAQK